MHSPLHCPPFHTTRGQIWKIGEGGEHGKLVVAVICMPERLGLRTYTEGPEQSLRGGKRRELEQLSCELLSGLLSCPGILLQLAAMGMFFSFLP